MADRTFKVVMGAMAAVALVPVGQFLKSAWDDAKEQADEAANPRQPWTDKNRWED
jgi:hypothetical protein